MSIHIGIDYSMTSPGIAVYDSEKDFVTLYSFSNSRVEKSKVVKDKFEAYVLTNAEVYKSQIQRYDMLARKVLAVLNRHELDKDQVVYIEGYSMGSKGQVFGIAENTAILKHYLFKSGITVKEIAPTSLKKFACGSGRAQKEDMCKAFNDKFGVDLKAEIAPNRKLGSPVTDLCDAYWIAHYAYSKERNVSQEKVPDDEVAEKSAEEESDLDE
jgi:Holliday junction resolvasome RuvABC endonuclease subunit